MIAAWRTHPVQPVGTRRAEGVACRRDGTAAHEWQEVVYPRSPAGERLRDERVRLGVGLRQAAQLLGMAARELSDLEAGRAAFDDDAEAARAMVLLRAEDRP